MHLTAIVESLLTINACPLRSVLKLAAVDDVFGTLSVAVSDTCTSVWGMPNSRLAIYNTCLNAVNSCHSTAISKKPESFSCATPDPFRCHRGSPAPIHLNRHVSMLHLDWGTIHQNCNRIEAVPTIYPFFFPFVRAVELRDLGLTRRELAHFDTFLPTLLDCATSESESVRSRVTAAHEIHFSNLQLLHVYM